MIHIVILAYNEAPVLEALLVELNAVLRMRAPSYRFVIVNDGSTDHTADIAADISRLLPVTLLHHEKNLGVGAAFNTGLRHVAQAAEASDIIVTMEGDRTNPPETLLTMLREMEKGYDVVCASRYRPGGRYVGFPRMRRVFSLAANWTMRVFFPVPGIRDYTIFFRAYRAGRLAAAIDAFGDAFIRCSGFSANVEILLKMALTQPIRCSEVSMVYRYDLKRGKSKMRVMSNIREYGALAARLMLRKCGIGRG